MNGMKTEEAGSRKKYLVPVVVLMLCLVALTGAAYAYSSNLQNSGNKVTSDILSLDLANGDVEADVVTGDNGEGIFVFTDNFTYNDENKSNVIKYETAEGFIAKYKITITGDAAFNTFNVDCPDLGVLKPMSSGSSPAKDLTMAQLFTFTYAVRNAGDTADVLPAKALGTATTLNEATPQMVKDTMYTVVITATPITTGDGNSGIVETVATVGHTAAFYKTAVAALSFTVSMTASQVNA